MLLLIYDLLNTNAGKLFGVVNGILHFENHYVLFIVSGFDLDALYDFFQ